MNENRNEAQQAGKLSRLALLKGVAGLSAVAALPGCKSISNPAASTAQSRRPEAIRTENLKAGTQDWLLQKTRIDPATKYRCPWIEGYCSRTSVRPGESIEIFV